MITPALALILTDEEVALLDSIEFNPDKLKGDEHRLRNGEQVLKLVLRLMARDAIPEHRWRWFTDPEYNFGGLGSSRRKIFERDAATDRDSLSQADFLPYLRYFIYGPDLPASVISAFDEKVRNCGMMVTSSDVVPLGRFARHQARAAGVEQEKAADEFFKLALEYDLGFGKALAIRKQVML